MKNELPDGWEWKKLGDVGELITGVTYKSNEAIDEPADNHIPILRANNINGEINFENLVYVPISRVKDRQLIRDNDILIAMSSGSKNIVGKAAQSGHDYYGSFGAFCGLFRCKEHVNKKYVGFFFKSSNYRTIISHLSRGANINNLRKENIKYLDIPIPPLETQHKIVAILEKAEETKKLRAQADELTQHLLQSVFLEMFGDPVSNPKGWSIATLEDILVELMNGLYLPKERYVSGAGIEMVHMSDAFYGVVEVGKLKMVNATDDEINKYCLTKNDLLIARRSLNYEGAAKACQIPEINKPLLFESSLIKITPDLNTVLPIYLYYYLNNEVVRKEYVYKYITKSTISGINQTSLKQISILLPPLEIQKKFASIVDKSEITKQYQQQSFQELDNLFNTLMQKAFTGELIH